MSEPEKKPRRRLSAKKRLLFAAVALGILFGVPEVVFQVREAVRASRKPRLPVEDCPYRITRLTPGAHVVREGQTIDINAFGLRGPEITLEKPAGTLRIACVGASTTFGLYAKDDASTWPAMLERSLRAQGRAVEVLNCGAPGWTSRASLTNLEMVVFGLKPDVVVIYHNHNDLLENGQQRYQQDSLADDWRALYHPTPLAQRVVQASAFVSFVRSRLRPEHAELELHKAPALDPLGTAAFERNLRRLVRRCQEQGARVLLCTYPRAYRDTLEASRAANVPDLERWYGQMCPIEYPAFMEGLRRYDGIVRTVGADAKVPVVDLVTLVPNDVALYVTPIHHTEAGEEKVSGFVRDALLAHGLLEPGHP